MRSSFPIAVALAAVVLIPTTCPAGFVVTAFAGTTYSANTAAMDAALGISGYTIEDFEDTTLIPGLTISFDGNIAAPTSFTILPKTFDTAGEPQTANNHWDGTRALTNAGNGQNGPFLPPAATNTTFTLASAAPVVGVGLANFQSALASGTNPFPVTDHTLFVNGQSLGTVEALAGANWTGGIQLRNAYLRIEGTGGDLITSVRFRNDTGSDFLVFDRFAVFAEPVQVVPAPPSVWLLVVGLVVLGAAKARRLRNCPE
jgi:hypothetical protein